MMYAGFWNALIFLPVVLAALVLLAISTGRFARAMNTLAAAEHRTTMIRGFSYARWIARIGCLIVALICVWFAILRVQYPGVLQQVNERGRDVIIAIDISRSMLAQDCTPNRLACAKQKIRALLQGLSSERVGLIVFASAALIQCPLTKDFDAFYLFLDALDVDVLSGGSTALSAALQTAMALFAQNPSRQKKLLVLVTDGEDFSENLAAMQQQAQEQGIAVCTIGIGTPTGAPIPLYDQSGRPIGHQKDAQGKVVISKLNESLLRSLSQSGSSMYVRADANEQADIRRMQQWVNNFDKEQLGTTQVQTYEETYMYWSGVALVLLTLGWFVL